MFMNISTCKHILRVGRRYGYMVTINNVTYGLCVLGPGARGIRSLVPFFERTLGMR